MVPDPDARRLLDAFEEYQVFFVDRVQRPGARRYACKRQKEHLRKRGKLLQYDKVTLEMPKLLDDSGLSEWSNHLKFEAVTVISREDAVLMLMSRDVEESLTRWLEVVKNEFERTEQADIPPRMKSRFLVRGDLSQVLTRSDFPTAEKDAFFTVLSFASSRRLTICKGDLDHGYFQGEKLCKPLIVRHPQGGLPEKQINPDDRMLCFVPIFATRDAG